MKNSYRRIIALSLVVFLGMPSELAHSWNTKPVKLPCFETEALQAHPLWFQHAVQEWSALGGLRKAASALTRQFQEGRITVTIEQALNLLKIPNPSESDLLHVLGHRTDPKAAMVRLLAFAPATPQDNPATATEPDTAVGRTVISLLPAEYEYILSHTMPLLYGAQAKAIRENQKLIISLDQEAFLPLEFDHVDLERQIARLLKDPTISSLPLETALLDPRVVNDLQRYFQKTLLPAWRLQREALLKLYLDGDVPSGAGSTERAIHVFAARTMQDRAHRPTLVIAAPTFEAWHAQLQMDVHHRQMENGFIDRNIEEFLSQGESYVRAHGRKMQAREAAAHNALENVENSRTTTLFIQRDYDAVFLIAHPAGFRRRYDQEIVERLQRGDAITSAAIAAALKHNAAYFALKARVQDLFPALEEEAICAKVMPIADRWPESDLDRLLLEPNETLAQFALAWVTQHGTPEEQALLRIGPGPSQTRFDIPSPTFMTELNPFGSAEHIVYLPGVRRGEFHYFKPLWDILEQTQPQVLRRLEKVLTTPFDELVQGRDFDFFSGGRSVLVALDWPLTINGFPLEALKLKAGVYHPNDLEEVFDLDARYWYQQSPKDGTFESDKMAPKIHPDGVYERVPRAKVMTGVTRLEFAKHELYANLRGRSAGLPFGLSLAYVVFPDHTDAEGHASGSPVIGVPTADHTRGSNYLESLFEEFADNRLALMEAIYRMLQQYARTLRHMNDKGVAIRNFHLSNAQFLADGSLFVHDTEDTMWRDDVSEPQFFGYVLVGLRDVLVSLGQIVRFPLVAHLRIPWVPLTAASYFYDQEAGQDLQMLVARDVAQLLEPGTKPYEQDSPFVRRLLKAMRMSS